MSSQTKEKISPLESVKPDQSNEIDFDKLVQKHVLESQKFLMDHIKKNYDEFKKHAEFTTQAISYLQKMSEEIKNSLDSIKKTMCSIEENSVIQNSQISSLNSITDDIEFHLDEKSHLIEKIFGELGSLKERQHESMVIFSGDDLALRSSLSTNFSYLDSAISELKSIAQTNKDEISNLKNKTSKDFSDLQEYKQRTFSTIESLTSLFQSTSNRQILSVKQLGDKLETFIQDQKDSPEPQDSNAKVLESISEMRKGFENVKIEVQNSYLRTANTATQVQMIEKKIENIYLLIKKIELDKSA